ncbi:HAUS augmin-like complex subunit 8 [Aplochiton taeniatus]
MVSSILEPANLGSTILQSTVLDGLDCNRPDLDVSVIKDRTMCNATEAGRNTDKEKSIEDIHNETLLLTYLAAKMESNTAKLRAEAEEQLLAVMEEEEHLCKEIQEKKRQCLLLEKNKQMNDLLDLQIAILTPVAEVAESFTEEYKSFGTAIDTTLHELPVKNFYIEGDRREFLDRAEACLKEGEKVLVDCTRGSQADNSTTLECLKGMTKSAQDISEELSGAFSELLELSSLVSRQTVYVQQALEEEHLGPARTKQLYCGQD